MNILQFHFNIIRFILADDNINLSFRFHYGETFFFLIFFEFIFHRMTVSLNCLIDFHEVPFDIIITHIFFNVFN